MSKKKACFYALIPLSKNRPYAMMEFYDRKERKMRSSVDIVLNLEYHDSRQIDLFVFTR